MSPGGGRAGATAERAGGRGTVAIPRPIGLKKEKEKGRQRRTWRGCAPPEKRLGRALRAGAEACAWRHGWHVMARVARLAEAARIMVVCWR